MVPESSLAWLYADAIRLVIRRAPPHRGASWHVLPFFGADESQHYEPIACNSKAIAKKVATEIAAACVKTQTGNYGTGARITVETES